METLAELCKADPELLLATPFRAVQLGDNAAVADITRWWEDVTAKGREGMVAKPLDFIVVRNRGIIQPAIECRGPGYLRIIYEPEYSRLDNLERLRDRALSTKRSIATRELRSASRSDSCVANHCGEFMSAHSVCWPLRASRSIRASSP